MKTPPRRPINTLLDMTPLIDCVFLLLIFFLLTSTFMEEKLLALQLPKAEQSIPLEKQAWQISIKNNGHYYIGVKQFTLQELITQFRQWKTLDSNKDQLVIRAENLVNIESIVSVMDAANKAGIVQIGIATQFSNGANILE